MWLTIGEIADCIEGTVEGPEETVVNALSDPSAAGPGDIAVLFGDGPPPDGCAAGVLVVGPQAEPGAIPCVRVENPRLALATLLTKLYPEQMPPPGVHQTAVVDPAASLGAGVSVGPCAVVGRAAIGEGAVIEAGCLIGDGVTVGAHTRLFPGVTVAAGCVIGDRVRIHPGAVIGADGFGYEAGPAGIVKIPQVGNVVIEDDVEIGALTAIDRATMPGTSTTVGRGAKIDNLVQIGHNCRIGRYVFICGLAGIAGSAEIGDGAIVGGHAGIKDHSTIGAGARIGGQAGTYGDVPAGEDYAGLPARPVRQHLRIEASLTRLPELLKRVSALERALAALQGETVLQDG